MSVGSSMFSEDVYLPCVECSDGVRDDGMLVGRGARARDDINWLEPESSGSGGESGKLAVEAADRRGRGGKGIGGVGNGLTVILGLIGPKVLGSAASTNTEVVLELVRVLGPRGENCGRLRNVLVRVEACPLVISDIADYKRGGLATFKEIVDILTSVSISRGNWPRHTAKRNTCLELPAYIVGHYI